MKHILSPIKTRLLDRLAASRKSYRITMFHDLSDGLLMPLSTWGWTRFREKQDGRQRLVASLEVLRTVARQDEDHARHLNGRGFSRSDSPAGRRLSKLSTYDVTRNSQLETDVLKLAQRYRKQATSIAKPKG